MGEFTLEGPLFVSCIVGLCFAISAVDEEQQDQNNGENKDTGNKSPGCKSVFVDDDMENGVKEFIGGLAGKTGCTLCREY